VPPFRGETCYNSFAWRHLNSYPVKLCIPAFALLYSNFQELLAHQDICRRRWSVMMNVCDKVASPGVGFSQNASPARCDSLLI
jgi:hypothetical protein